jgi:hypothetical protein
MLVSHGRTGYEEALIKVWSSCELRNSTRLYAGSDVSEEHTASIIRAEAHRFKY